MQPSVLQQHHPTSAAASQDQSHSTTDSSSKRTCQFSRLFYPSIQYFNDDTFEKRCYFNDGNAEGCYFTVDNFDYCYFNDNNFEKSCYFTKPEETLKQDRKGTTNS